MTIRSTLLAAVCLACAAAVPAWGAAGTNGGRFTVTSSIDGKHMLPLRSHWLAHPKLPAAQVKEVDFLIDGKVRWIEHQSPYNYASDDFHGHLGYLITTWLAPGRHTFSARAVDRSGHTATDRVVATVAKAPPPPAELAGTWTRTVTPADLKKSGPQPPPAGVWRLIFDPVGAWHLDPLGSGLANQYSVAGDVVHVYAPIQMAPLVNGHTTTSRYGAHSLGGQDCREDGPFGSYTWSLSGTKLTLTARDEPCGNRRAIWEGTWKRLP